MANKIFVVIEQRDGIVKKVSFEVATLASKLAAGNNKEVIAIAVGGTIDSLSELGHYGVAKVVFFKHPELQLYSPSAYAKVIAEYVKQDDGAIILLGNSALGRDLAPRLAARIPSALVTDAVEVSLSGATVTATRPVYAGKAMQQVQANGSSVITVRPNVVKPEKSASADAVVEEVTGFTPDLAVRVTGITKAEGKLDVAEADIIVSGGRGLKAPEHFHLVEELADALGAAVGASRAVVDAGWRSHGEQVGQTGKTVSPSLYVACGISGAIQHLAGMSSSKYIVAINKDKDAPIFQIADYGIAGDVFEILPKLTEEIKKLKS